MKEYLVITDYGKFIVSARDAKDSIDIIYYELSKEHLISKSEIKARSLGSLHTEHGKIINMN